MRSRRVITSYSIHYTKLYEPLLDRNVVRNSHEGEEFLFVLSGKVEVFLDKYSDVLSEGDCIYYNSTIPHHVHSTEEREALILAVLYQGK